MWAMPQRLYRAVIQEFTSQQASQRGVSGPVASATNLNCSEYGMIHLYGVLTKSRSRERLDLRIRLSSDKETCGTGPRNFFVSTRTASLVPCITDGGTLFHKEGWVPVSWPGDERYGNCASSVGSLHGLQSECSCPQNDDILHIHTTRYCP